MISVTEALQIVEAQTAALPAETVALDEALGRILAEDIIADTDLPPFDRAQMDGYAVRANDTQQVPARLRVVGESAAGAGWHQEMKGGEAVRIMTGAPVPKGADSVQQVELTRAPDGPGEVEILERVETGRSIVKQGSEITAGQRVLQSGERIDASMMAVLASFGYATVKVGKQPRVAVLATGSELVAVNQRPGQDQIRDSNNYSIAAYALLAGAAVERLPLATDDTQMLKEQISKAAETSDMVISSGGVSMGVYDFTKLALKELKAEIFFERVALRPGKPIVFGRFPSGTLVFGLPGNPVSVAVTFNLFVRSALQKMQGASDLWLKEDRAILARDVKGAGERENYLPARLFTDDKAQLIAEPLKWGGSSDFVGFTRATALIVVPPEVKLIAGGATAKVVRLP